MIGIAVVILLPLAFFLFKSNLALQKGMAIPVCLLLALNIAYGSYVLYSKPTLLLQTETKFYSNPEQTLDSELQKAKSNDKSYLTAKFVWGLCTIMGIVLYFVSSKDYYKGLSIGFAGLFFGFLLIDSFFHQRLTIFMKTLQAL